METSLVEARQQAATAIEAGRKMALRASQQRRGAPLVAGPSGADLGAVISDPAAFWATAAAIQAQGDDDTVGAVSLATQLAGARLVAGDLGFVRESLLGQAQWLGVLAVRLAHKADAQSKPEDIALCIKLALAAQRQAAQCLASAAALGRLGVDVTGG